MTRLETLEIYIGPETQTYVSSHFAPESGNYILEITNSRAHVSLCGEKEAIDALVETMVQAVLSTEIKMELLKEEVLTARAARAGRAEERRAE